MMIDAFIICPSSLRDMVLPTNHDLVPLGELTELTFCPCHVGTLIVPSKKISLLINDTDPPATNDIKRLSSGLSQQKPREPGNLNAVWSPVRGFFQTK